MYALFWMSVGGSVAIYIWAPEVFAKAVGVVKEKLERWYKP